MLKSSLLVPEPAGRLAVVHFHRVIHSRRVAIATTQSSFATTVRSNLPYGGSVLELGLPLVRWSTNLTNKYQFIRSHSII
jgi:hypothetical protein